MIGQIIFISGIHGVGKTTLCNKASKIIGINSYSSSDLIRKFKSIYNNEKNVDNIDKNQDLLLESIKVNIKDKKAYILDGHFILLNKNYDFNEVPLNTFMGMDIKHIIILYNDVDTITRRLNNRDGSNYTKRFIEEFQKKEMDRGVEVAKALGKPYNIIKSDDIDSLIVRIRNVI